MNPCHRPGMTQKSRYVGDRGNNILLSARTLYHLHDVSISASRASCTSRNSLLPRHYYAVVGVASGEVVEGSELCDFCNTRANMTTLGNSTLTSARPTRYLENLIRERITTVRLLTLRNFTMHALVAAGLGGERLETSSRGKRWGSIRQAGGRLIIQLVQCAARCRALSRGFFVRF